MRPFVITSILAPTDLSDSSIPALRYARLFADRFNAKLTVMYTDPIVYPVNMAGPLDELYVSATPDNQARLRKEVELQAEAIMAGRPYDIDVTIGQPVPAILASVKERNADLIIMGTHLRHGWRRALLGSVSEGVLHGSDCPVLTVATQDSYVGAAPYAVTHVLCPVNFTDVARESLHVAARLADAFRARLTIVHVLEADEVRNVKEEEERVRSWITPELQEVCAYRQLVVRGGPAERVLDCADDVGADFLVIGAQHKLFRDATVLGTTSERMIRFSSCPVLVVPRQAIHRDATVAASVVGTEAAGELAVPAAR
jgi:nucleotide-binding universal stress UspA family protein